MTKRLYIAYGSNLNLRQMAMRCPTAQLVGTGEVRDYELQFKGQPHGAFATIGSKDGASVPVAVWSLRSWDEKALDMYAVSYTHLGRGECPPSFLQQRRRGFPNGTRRNNPTGRSILRRWRVLDARLCSAEHNFLNAVSYTHLDVYKRQWLFYCISGRPKVCRSASGSAGPPSNTNCPAWPIPSNKL